MFGWHETSLGIRNLCLHEVVDGEEVQGVRGAVREEVQRECGGLYMRCEKSMTKSYPYRYTYQFIKTAHHHGHPSW